MKTNLFCAFAVVGLCLVGCGNNGDSTRQTFNNDGGFNWGSGCEGGSGSFSQSIAHEAVIVVGTIPKDKANIVIKLSSNRDVDIQLFAEDGTKLVQYPDGVLNGPTAGSTVYNGVTISYSGYNGNGTGLGNEFIKLEGVTKNSFVMKAYGYAAGQAQVDYTFEAKPGCQEGSGSGSFAQAIPHNGVVKVGDIPAGLENIEVKLKSSVDIDIQLYHGSTRVVHWTGGLLKKATQETKTYEGMSITWSGYNGDGTGLGNEFIKIDGKTTVKLTMRGWAMRGAPPKGDTVGGGGSGGGYKSFSQRVQALKAKYSSKVTLATKQGKPAIFVKTDSFSSESQTKAFYADLYKMVGGNTIMIWNPAGDNYFHLAFGQGYPNSKLSQKYYKKAMRLYSVIHVWDIEGGNLDSECYDDDDYDEDSYVDWNDEVCIDDDQVGAERAVALIKLTNTQLKELDKYLNAIVDDFPGTLGPEEYNGGTPPYFGGSQHNCTSWFSVFLDRKVSSSYPTYANPASLMKSITTGGYNGQLTSSFRALLVFNHSDPPQSGATISKNFPLDFGH